jgi:protein-S-isoprenylcysteine O-methyltransferase Ste14
MFYFYIPVYCLFLFYYFIESFARKGKDSKIFRKTQHDKSSTKLIAVAFILSSIIIFLSPLLNYFNIGLISNNIALNIIGIFVGLAGIGIRMAAISALGRFYMRTLRETNEHKLINTGIYKYLRHPGYLGTILLFIGASFAMRNYITVITVIILIIGIYIYRINVEEEMLIKIFSDEYIEYKKKSKRIIPLIY